MPSVVARRFVMSLSAVRRTAPLLVLGIALHTSALSAQIRGTRPVAQDPNYGWWFSGGANAVILGDIADGKSNTRWRFGNDPLWQFRATLEKALDEGSTIGVAAGYGVVDVALDRLVAVPSLPPGPTGACAISCEAQTELWTLMGQFRSGSRPRGFHTVFVLSGGATAFRNFKERATGDSIPSLGEMRTDLSGSLGFGFGYGLGSGMGIELIQDVGIGWHSNENLPEGQGRTWRSRTTRAGLRFKF